MKPGSLHGKIFDAVRDPLLVVDETGEVRAANAAALRVADLSAGVGASADASRQRFSLDTRAIGTLVRRGERAHGVSVLDRAGRETGIEVDIEPLTGTPGHCLLHFRGRTEAHAREFWTDDAVAAVAHEFRNPLAAIRSALDVMCNGDAGELNDVQSRFVETARRSATRLSRIVDGYLDLARVRAGALSIDRAERDARVMVSEITGDIATLYRGLQGRLDVDIAHDVRDAYVDGDRLAQVLVNLVCNAARFTPGERRIAVRVSRAGREALDDDLRLLPWDVLGDPRFVRFDVEDQGIGMSHDTLAHVFDRYHAGENDACDAETGAHLGLCISRALVEAHDGWMTVDSRLGEGTVVSVLVPEDERTAVLVSRLRAAATTVRRLRAARRSVSLAMIGGGLTAGESGDADRWRGVAIVNPSPSDASPVDISLWVLRARVALAVVPDGCDEVRVVRCLEERAHPGDAEIVMGICAMETGVTFAQALRHAATRMKHGSDEPQDVRDDRTGGVAGPAAVPVLKTGSVREGANKENDHG